MPASTSMVTEPIHLALEGATTNKSTNPPHFIQCLIPKYIAPSFGNGLQFS